MKFTKKATGSIIVLSVLTLAAVIGFQNCSSSKNNNNKTLRNFPLKQPLHPSLVGLKSVKELPNLDVEEKVGYTKVEDEQKFLSTTIELKEGTKCSFDISLVPQLRHFGSTAGCTVEITNNGIHNILVKNYDNSERTIAPREKIEISAYSQGGLDSPVIIPIKQENGTYYTNYPLTIPWPDPRSRIGPTVLSYTPATLQANPKITTSPYEFSPDNTLGEPEVLVYYAYCDQRMEAQTEEWAAALASGYFGDTEAEFTDRLVNIKDCERTLTVYSSLQFENSMITFPGATFPDTGNPIYTKYKAVRIMPPINKAPCPSNLPTAPQNYYSFAPYREECGANSASVRIEFDLANFTDSDIARFRLEFTSRNAAGGTIYGEDLSVEDATPVSNANPNIKSYYIETYPSNLVTDSANGVISFRTTGDNDSDVEGQFNIYKEYFYIDFAGSNGGTPGTVTMDVNEVLNETIIAKNTNNNNFYACAERKPANGVASICSSGSFVAANDLVGTDYGFTCENGAVRKCTRSRTLKSLGFTAGTYNVHAKNDSVGFANINQTFELIVTGTATP